MKRPLSRANPSTDIVACVGHLPALESEFWDTRYCGKYYSLASGVLQRCIVEVLACLKTIRLVSLPNFPHSLSGTRGSHMHVWTCGIITKEKLNMDRGLGERRCLTKQCHLVQSPARAFTLIYEEISREWGVHVLRLVSLGHGSLNSWNPKPEIDHRDVQIKTTIIVCEVLNKVFLLLK